MITFILTSNLRLIAKNKFISAVKILGLASGSAVVLLTMQFCFNELQYDKQHQEYERIFRYVHHVNTPEGPSSFALTSATTGPALKERFPEVKSYCRILRPANVSLKNISADVSFNEPHFAFADANFFELFNFPVSGNPDEDILKEPFSVVLTPASAIKYFGETDPVGKTILLNGEVELVVKGVLKEAPRNTHMKFDFLCSFSSLEIIPNHPLLSKQIPAAQNLEHKGFNSFHTYLLLATTISAQSLESKFPAYIEEFRGEGRSKQLKPYLQSLASIHLNSSLHYEMDQNGSLKEVYVYLAIGLITLLISCINYINLSTAEFMKRVQGIGLKKILGIDKSTLALSHFLETTMLAIISMTLGYILASSLLPVFNNLVNRNIELWSIETLYLFLVIFILIIAVSGVYPALKISQVGTMQAFRGSLQASPSFFNLRNGLVSFQLLVSFCLITLSLLIFFQLDYLLSRDLGFDKDQILILNATSVDPKERSTFKKSFAESRYIHNIAMCSTPPGEPMFTYGLTLPENDSDEDRRVTVYQSFVDEGYLETLGLKIDSGRFFDVLNSADSDRYMVINRTAMEAFGDSVFSRQIAYNDPFKNKSVAKTVVGVIDDFNFTSLHEEVQPLMLEYDPDYCRYYLVRFNKSEVSNVLIELQNAWKMNFPLTPFDYYFLDDRFQTLYDNDTRQKKLVTSIAIIAISLAALGIFGTTLFMVEQKSRQIGIRKILGSNQMQLLALLLRPTFFLITISCLVGIPLATYFGTSWLSQYPNRIDFSPFLFVISFFLIGAIVVTTILYHCLKLTRINPIEVLRNSDH